jgi:Site-specific recombinase XerD
MEKRRGNNEGSITQRENGTWRVQLSFEGKRLSHTAKTRKECQEWIKQINHQIEEGLSIAGEKMLLGQYLTTWLKTVKENRKPKTFIQYKGVINRYILPEFGNLKLSNLKPIQIEKYLVSLQQQEVDRTAQVAYAILHVSLKKAVKQGLIGRNPMDAVEKPKVKNPRTKLVLSIEDIQKLLIAAEGDRIAFLLHFTVITGMREAELFGLQWKDVDWEKKTINVVRQVQRLDGQGMIFTSPKTRSGNRRISIGSMTMEKLKEQRENQQIEKEIAGDHWIDNDLIFPSTKGTPMDPHNLLKNFHRILEKAGLPKMRFHDLRHTSITLVLNEIGAPIKEAQKRAGHASPTTTINIYGGETTSKLDEIVAQGMDELVTPMKIELHQNCTKERSLQYL